MSFGEAHFYCKHGLLQWDQHMLRAGEILPETNLKLFREWRSIVFRSCYIKICYISTFPNIIQTKKKPS